MKAVVKALLVCFMVLATTLQGFAATSMLLCEPIGQQVVTHEHEDMHATHHHEAMTLDSGSRHDDASLQHNHGNHHGAAKCNACSACCMLVAMTAPEFHPATSAAPESQAIPFLGRALQAFVPESLDPPPRNLTA